MKSKFLIYFALVISSTVNSQKDFFKLYNNFYTGDQPSIVQLPDSGYIMFHVYNPSSSDQALRRFDKFGNVIWSKYFNLSTTEGVGRIILTKNNDLLLTGLYGNNKINVFKIDLNGSFKFQKVYAGLSTLSIPSENCNIIEASNSDLYLTSKNAVIRLDSMGNVKWARGMPLNGLELRSVHQISANNFVALGSVQNYLEPNSYNDLVQISFDTTGATKYIKIFGASSNERSCGGALMTNGNFFHFFGYDFYKEKENGLGVMCTDTLGNQLWTKILKNPINPNIILAKLKDGSIAGLYGNGTNGCILRLDNIGNIVTNFKFLSTSMAFNYTDMCGTMDGGLILTPFESGNKALLKLPSNLNSKCKQSALLTPKVNYYVFNNISLSNYGPGGALTSSSTTLALTSLTVSPVSSSCTNTCSVKANFSESSLNVCVGSNISFTNTSTAGTTSSWKVNNILVSNSTNLTHQFSAAGVYTVALYANGICTDSVKKIVIVDGNTTPDFTYTKSFLKVRFIPTVYLNNSLYVWNFGDGDENKLQDTVWHCYDNVGTYSVCLTTSNTCGSFQKCKTITVNSDASYVFNKEYDDVSISNMDQYGGDVVQSQDGGYYVCGIDNSYGSAGWKGIVSKLDTGGNHIWTRILNINPGSSQQEIDYLSKTRDGGVLFSGCAWNTANYHGVGRLDSSGSGYIIKFATSNSSEKPGESIELKNGNILFSGSRSGVGYLMQVSKGGQIGFFRGYSMFKGITSVKQGSDRAYYVYGNNNLSNAPALMKLDSNFNFIWAKSIAISSTVAVGTDIEISKSGKIYLTGKINTSTFIPKMFTVCVDTACNVLWAKIFSRQGSQCGRSIVIDKKGDLYISSSGMPFTTSTPAERGIFKIDSLGNLKNAWAGNASNLGISLTYDNGITISGTSQSFFNSLEYNINLIKIDSLGFNNCQASVATVSIAPTTAIVSSITGTLSTGIPSYTLSLSFINYQIWDSVRCSSFITTNVTDQKKDIEFNLFPNPAEKSITIQSEQIIYKVEIISIDGQIVYVQKTDDTNIKLEINNLSNGVYFVKVNHANKDVAVKKLIIQK